MPSRSPNQHALVALLCVATATSWQFKRSPERMVKWPRERMVWGAPASQRASPAEEWDIYSRHWAPLDPAPGHFPFEPPTQEHVHAGQSVEANYTRYWQSLPRYPPVSPRLALAEQAPYFKTAWRTEEASWHLSASDVLFAGHHKTGQNLHNNIVSSLRPLVSFQTRWDNMVPASCPPPGARLLHLVRHPVDMIASGYRYHQNRWGAEIWSWGHAKRQDPQCFDCDDEDHAALFETCAFNCTYFELLNRLDEVTGSSIEAVASRRSVTNMANFLARCRHRPNMLHVSFDLFRTNYTQSAACILRFLGLNSSEVRLHRESLAGAMEHVRDPDHVTSDSFDNTRVKEHLRNHPAWGPDFAAVDVLMDEAFDYQAQTYGCPRLEFSRQPAKTG